MMLFCPNCHGLLRRKNVGKHPSSYCPKCGYNTEDDGETDTTEGAVSGYDPGKGEWPRGVATDLERAHLYTGPGAGAPSSRGGLQASGAPGVNREITGGREADGGTPRTSATAAGPSGEPHTMEARDDSIGPVGTTGIPELLFPFDSIREGQRQMALDWKATLEAGKHLVAYAPTGIGKTAAALGPALRYGLDHQLKVFFLTSKQSQHTIAVNTLKAISNVFNIRIKVADIIAKQHMCPRPMAREHPLVFNEFCKVEMKTHHCRYFNNSSNEAMEHLRNNIMHVNEAQEYLSSMKMCPHKVEMELAREADVVICDYNYLFSDMYENILNAMDLDVADILLVVDEAHNLPDRVRAHLSDDLTQYRLNEAYNETRPLDKRLALYLRGLRDILKKMGKEIGDRNREARLEREALIDPIEQMLGASLTDRLDLDGFIEGLLDLGQRYLQQGAMKSSIISVANFLDGWRQSTPSMVRYILRDEGERLSYRLLDPSVISRGVFQNVRASLIMSGTLYPTQMFVDLLGHAPERTLQREYTTPFPKENRQVMVTGGLTTLYRSRGPAMYDLYGNMIALASENIPGNIAIFTQSYDMLSEVRYQIEKHRIPKKLIVEERGMRKPEREAILKELERTMRWSGAILLGVQGGSFSEGVDYRNNMLSAVIVVGVPFPPPSVETNALKAYYSKRFGQWKGYDYSYLYPAIGKVLQAAGRGIRSHTDRGVVILADERFAQPKYARAFPAGLRPGTTQNLARDLTRFFDRD